jgi:hypothetical protein
MERITEEYYRANASYLSPEALEEITQSRGSIKNASKVMAGKYKISTRRVYEIWNKHAKGISLRKQQIVYNQLDVSAVSTHCGTAVQHGTTPTSNKRNTGIGPTSAVSISVSQDVFKNQSESAQISETHAVSDKNLITGSHNLQPMKHTKKEDNLCDLIRQDCLETEKSLRKTEQLRKRLNVLHQQPVVPQHNFS